MHNDHRSCGVCSPNDPISNRRLYFSLFSTTSPRSLPVYIKSQLPPLFINLDFFCPSLHCCCNFFCPKAGPLLFYLLNVTSPPQRQISIRAPISDQKFRILILVTRHSSPWLAIVCTCVPLPTDCLRPFVIRFLQPLRPDSSRCLTPHGRVSRAPPSIAIEPRPYH